MGDGTDLGHPDTYETGGGSDYRPGELGTGFLGVFLAAVVVWFLYIGEGMHAVYVTAVLAFMAVTYASIHADSDTTEDT